jgi:UDP-2-acetamido-3-amino-2,3-dideoxy-glucuronate N-acetyltransferase
MPDDKATHGPLGDLGAFPSPPSRVQMSYVGQVGFAFVDPSSRIPASSQVWHFAIVLANCKIGNDVNIGGGAEIGRGTTIGDRTRISSGVFLPSNSVIGSDVFIGPNVTCTDDRFPKTLKPGETYKAEPPVIEDGASVGAGAVILPGVRIGKGSRVAAGAIVTRDVPDGLAVKGLPAKRFELSTDAKKAFLSDFAETLSLGGQ